jgi:hypothetical protein
VPSLDIVVGVHEGYLTGNETCECSVRVHEMGDLEGVLTASKGTGGRSESPPAGDGDPARHPTH